ICAVVLNGAYLHKSIDKRRLNGHIPRPLNCPYRTHLGVGPWLISNQLRSAPFSLKRLASTTLAVAL
ncbi:hypothetical protein DZK42_14610, partial [Enterococcus faecalis]|nr:hypothetical protein [Enterococcus faecalis]